MPPWNDLEIILQKNNKKIKKFLNFFKKRVDNSEKVVYYIARRLTKVKRRNVGA